MATKGKVRALIKIIEADGWREIKTGLSAGDHRQYKHATKKGKVTIDGKKSEDVPPKIWNNVLRQAKLI